jgi:hypothetical protein
MTDDNSVEFSVVYKRRNRIDTTTENDSHQCKTVVKIEPQYMQKFGIKEGDIVKISGNTKSTVAICLPMSDSDLQEINAAPQMEVEFLNNPEKKAQYYPKIILYDPVLYNVDILRKWQRTVKLSKFSESSIRSENIPEAKLVTLATADIADKMMSGYQSNLDYSGIMGFVVTKNDRIYISFKKEWFEKKQQQEMQRKENQNEYSHIDNRRQNRSRSNMPPSFPTSFQSIIIDVSPKGKPFWNITENTRFEFKDTDFAKIFADPYRFTPKKLVNVVSISKQLFVDDTEFTIPSLEVYSNMMKLIWYSHQRVKIPESDFTDMHKMHHMHGRMHNAPPILIITLEDDLGNRYVSTNESGGGGGGSSGPDPTTREFISDFSGYHIFSPTLDPNAKEIIVTIKEIQWVR